MAQKPTDTQGADARKPRGKRRVRQYRDNGGDRILLDEDTGEVVAEEEEIEVIIGHTPRIWKREDWGVYFGRLATDLMMHGLSRTEGRVLWGLLVRLDYENWVVVNQTEMAGVLDLHQSQISRAIATLQEREILFDATDDPDAPPEVSELGSLKAYRLNPNFVWRGKRREVIRARSWWESRVALAKRRDPSQLEARLE